MEKFSQFRDKGSGIAPFLPIPREPAGLYLPLHALLYICRVPLFVFFYLLYFSIVQFLPLGALVRKASLWCLLGIPGIWWIDLQIDGVKKGSLAQHTARLPKSGSIIASSFNSPIDALYLAAIFDPIFATCYPYTRLVEPITLFQAVLRAFSQPPSQLNPPPHANLVEVETYLRRYPNRVLVLFPECTTSNGRGILPLTPALASIPPRTKVFPVHLRYTPADITSPIPHSYSTFMWNLCSKPTHCIRIRIAEAIPNPSRRVSPTETLKASSVEVASADSVASDADTLVGSDDGLGEAPQTKEGKIFLDRVGESLARLGRIKRVGLGVKEKADFVARWSRGKRR